MTLQAEGLRYNGLRGIMITDQFGAIIQELGQALHNPKLHPDEHNSCLIKFKGDIQIQIEPDRNGKYLIIGCNLGSIPAGRYRENIFAEALKSNGLPSPRHGFFAYSKRTDSLVLTEMMSLQDLTGQKVADFLTPFKEKIKIWKEAIARGEVPVIATAFTGKPTGMFGMGFKR